MSLSNYPLSFLRCRTFGHSWEDFVPVGKRRPGFGYRLSILCTVCGTERHDLFDVLGHVGAREYVYPEDYHLGYVVTRAEARTEYRKRIRLRKNQ